MDGGREGGSRSRLRDAVAFRFYSFIVFVSRAQDGGRVS